MNKLNRVKTLVLCMFVIIILYSAVMPVIAESGQKQLTVMYNNIKLIIDNKEVTPQDADGVVVEPFIYDGTTYLPVRAISQALGNEVYWDSENFTIYVNKADKAKTKTWEVNGNLASLENFDVFLNTIIDVFAIFEKYFGKETMSRIDLYIDNAVGHETTGWTPIITPILQKYLIIKLGVSNFSYKEQTAFQFSHELCHYVFYSVKGLDKTFADDREENICAAMSLIIIRELFPESFDLYYDYVAGLSDEAYSLGAGLATEMHYDINMLKQEIYK